MKTLLLTLILMATAWVSFNAVATGSNINKSTIIKATTNINVVNAAFGKGAKANVGSIVIKGSKISKSTLINRTTNKNVTNTAIGKGSEASSGSISIK